MGEFQKIEAIRKWLGRSSKASLRGKKSGVIVDIGDDAAVLDWKFGNLVVTSDSQVENVHFRMKHTTPEELGHRLLSVNLSDLAAMGATPRAAVVSLCLTKQIGERFLEPFYKGMRKLAAKEGVAIVGGNLSSTASACVFDLTAFGNVAGTPLTRAGAKVGDLIAVSGFLGDSAAGRFALERQGRAAVKRWPSAVLRHVRPSPQVELGKALSQFATSAIDLSDGLSSELHHLAKASGLSFWVSESALPISQACLKIATHYRKDPVEWALDGGEDYQLLFTFSPRDAKRLHAATKAAGQKLTVLGFTVARKRRSSPVLIQRRNRLENEALPARGWVHS